MVDWNICYDSLIHNSATGINEKPGLTKDDEQDVSSRKMFIWAECIAELPYAHIKHKKWRSLNTSYNYVIYCIQIRQRISYNSLMYMVQCMLS